MNMIEQREKEALERRVMEYLSVNGLAKEEFSPEEYEDFTKKYQRKEALAASAVQALQFGMDTSHITDNLITFEKSSERSTIAGQIVSQQVKTIKARRK